MQIWSNLDPTQRAKIGEKICTTQMGGKRGTFRGLMKIFDKLHLFLFSLFT